MTINRCIIDMVKIVPGHTELWDETVLTANLLRNRMFRKSGNMGNETPLEDFIGNKPDLSKIRLLGSKLFIHVLKKRTGKLSDR